MSPAAAQTSSGDTSIPAASPAAKVTTPTVARKVRWSSSSRPMKRAKRRPQTAPTASVRASHSVAVSLRRFDTSQARARSRITPKAQSATRLEAKVTPSQQVGDRAPAAEEAGAAVEDLHFAHRRRAAEARAPATASPGRVEPRRTPFEAPDSRRDHSAGDDEDEGPAPEHRAAVDPSSQVDPEDEAHDAEDQGQERVQGVERLAARQAAHQRTEEEPHQDVLRRRRGSGVERPRPAPGGSRRRRRRGSGRGRRSAARDVSPDLTGPGWRAPGWQAPRRGGTGGPVDRGRGRDGPPRSLRKARQERESCRGGPPPR